MHFPEGISRVCFEGDEIARGTPLLHQKKEKKIKWALPNIVWWNENLAESPRRAAGLSDGAGVQPEGAGTGRAREGAGGVQPQLQRRPDAAAHGAAEKHPALEGGGQEPDSVLWDQNRRPQVRTCDGRLNFNEERKGGNKNVHGDILAGRREVTS